VITGISLLLLPSGEHSRKKSIMELFQHQSKIIKEDKKHFGKWLGTGGGKTRICLELAEGRTLVIAPKQQVLDQTWEKNADRFGIVINMTVLSKETFRRDWNKLPYFDTVIVDEAHTMFGVTPDTRRVNKIEVPKTSQLFEALRLFLVKHPPKRFYPATATPASKPMNVWAIATLFGAKWDFFRFREKYYFQRKSGWRSIWLPRNTQDLKDRLAELLRQFGDVGRLQDWFDVPEQTHTTHYVGLTSEQQKVLADLKQQEVDPMVKRAKQRTIENGVLYETDVQMITTRTERMVRMAKTFKSEKIEYILERAEEFPKILIFANYTAQIHAIADALERAGKKVYRLTGKTENRGDIFASVELLKECIVVAQCSISSGYEWKSCDCVIFASKSFKFLDYDQGIGRVLRADALKKNLYIHLVVKGGVDEQCHKTILSGQDFQEKIYGKVEEESQEA
jgi:hypothetical protein